MSNAQAYGSGVTYNQPITRRTAGKVTAGTLATLLGLMPATATAGESDKIPVPKDLGGRVLQLKEGEIPTSILEQARKYASQLPLESRYQNAQQANGGTQSGEEAGKPWYKRPGVIIPIVVGGVVVGYIVSQGQSGDVFGGG